MKHRKRPRLVVVTCGTCRTNVPSTAAAMLGSAADALNACQAAGLGIRLRHGAIQCAEGLILPLPDGKWVARTRLYTPFGTSSDEED